MSITISGAKQFLEVFQENHKSMYVNFKFGNDDPKFREQNDYFEKIADKYYNSEKFDGKIDLYKLNLNEFHDIEEVKVLLRKERFELYYSAFIGYYYNGSLCGFVRTDQKKQVEDFLEDVDNDY
ncbi:hypothetical protein BN7_2446 [Wickerhamomyces ciferrii]|uniref:Uncharacterized protein n=1 Tax=Wickerhamomyces ciferrii (strain ATCC 14091 / BCRC 22168 / CBS 111 / JCM 3599 / NBRC 0793 / NRRL Y-1031 F-60-10) TaxID=1206466 RepID=K0KCT2_WICCF|nr:uncharacterized protein BN7_2446 [Wickerhamomyces ciferrii]CCH42900.1 hypothetical protein BN7_2446 [Wickerhamomyces ciferrii]